MSSNLSVSKKDYMLIMKLISSLSNFQNNSSEKLQPLLSQLFGFHSTVLWKVDDKEKLYAPITYRLKDNLMDEYLSHFYNLDFLYPTKQKDLFRKNIALRLEDIIPMNNYVKSSYYNEFMKKYNYLDEMVVTFFKQNKLVGALGIARNIEDGKFSKVDCDIFRIIAPFISNILYWEQEQEKNRMEKEILESFSNQSDTGLIILDQYYKVTYMNSAAWDINRNINHQGDLYSLVQRIVSNSLSNTSTKLFTSEFQYYNAQLIANKAKNFSKECRYAIVMKKSKNQHEELESKKIYNLTNREKEVCHYIIKGYTYQFIAEELVVSVNTVKKHIKNIYRKTGVKNRSSLQALIS